MPREHFRCTLEFEPDGPTVSEKDYFFYTGRLERRKGVHLLIQAFREVHRRHPRLRLILAGHDTPTFLSNGQVVSFQDYCMNHLAWDGMDEAVKFIGRLDRRDLPPWYRGSLGAVFPSESFENFPYSCLEAMACGKGVIVSDSGGMTEMVSDGNSGLVVPAGSVEALAQAMLRFAEDPTLAAKLGQAARQRVQENFSLQPITIQTVQKYREVLTGAR